MKKSFLVIGLGRYGANIVKVLAMNKCDCLAIDVKEECVKQVSKYNQNCLIADGTKYEVLKELDANKFSHVIVAIGNNLQASILTVLNLKKLGCPLITVRTDDAEYKEIFKSLGANDVIVPEEDSAISTGNQILSDSVLDYYDISDDYAIVKVVVNDNFKGGKLVDLNFRNKYDVNIVGIIRCDRFFIPRGQDTVNPGDVLVIGGENEKVFKFDSIINK